MAPPRLCGTVRLGRFGNSRFTPIGAWERTDLTYAFTGELPEGVSSKDAGTALRAAFDVWSSARSQFQFTEVFTSVPDIEVSWRAAADIGGAIARADYPPGHSIYVDELPIPLYFNAEVPWSGAGVSDRYDVLTVAVHEIGHCLGLDHSGIQGAVMYAQFKLGPGNTRLHQDDLRGIDWLYPTD